MDYIHETEAELGINLDIPLSEQDPLNKLNDLANKKRKHADDIHDYFKANKRLKSSIQYEDHPAGTVLNEHVLGPGLDDHARTFSSLLLAEIDKRNLNPLKQIRTIEQLRHFTQAEVFQFEKLSSASALQALRRLGSIFTSVYAADQNLKKAYKVYKAGKRLLYVKSNKAISLGVTNSKVGIEVQQLFLKGLYLSLSSKKITPQLSFNHLAILQARMQAARDRQKSYADVKHKPLEFQVGDQVMLKVSPWKGVIRFRKREKLNPRYIGPFKKCLSDESLVIPLEEIQIADKLYFIEEPVEIMDREVKRLKKSRISILKVRWNSRRGPEFT
ncbi:hypothetical protein Tco_0453331 [Tanacetum coccineum]